MEYTNQTFRGRSIFDLNDDSNVMISGEIKIEHIIPNNGILQSIYHKTVKGNQYRSTLTHLLSCFHKTWNVGNEEDRGARPVSRLCDRLATAHMRNKAHRWTALRKNTRLLPDGFMSFIWDVKTHSESRPIWFL